MLWGLWGAPPLRCRAGKSASRGQQFLDLKELQELLEFKELIEFQDLLAKTSLTVCGKLDRALDRASTIFSGEISLEEAQVVATPTVSCTISNRKLSIFFSNLLKNIS